MTAQEAKRAFVTVLLVLAAVYGLVLNINRDSVDTELVSAFKRVARKAHPYKGGTVEDSARLHASRDAWKDAFLGRRKPGRPSSGSAEGDNERGPRGANGVRRTSCRRAAGVQSAAPFKGESILKRRTAHTKVPLVLNCEVSPRPP